jgi:hypothetical protein
VTGLWPLLEPCGRRINIEALRNKRLAVGELPKLNLVSQLVPASHISPLDKLPSPPPPVDRLEVSADASVWLFHFVKAMRDERGELIRNAHLLGFFRRICRWDWGWQPNVGPLRHTIPCKPLHWD